MPNNINVNPDTNKLQTTGIKNIRDVTPPELCHPISLKTNLSSWLQEIQHWDLLSCAQLMESLIPIVRG